MIRNELFDTNGVCLEATVFDVATRTVTREENGVVVSTRQMTDDEWNTYSPFPPLDAVGALATLLVVDSVISLEDASNATGVTQEHLVAEAEAWTVG